MSEKPDPLISSTHAILNDYSKAQDKWLKEKQSEITVYCSKGCDFCCNISAKISIPEALVLINIIENAQIEKIMVQAEYVRKLWRSCSGDEDLYFEKYRSPKGRCVFLSDEGACSVHRYRPLPCRQTMSGLPGEFCASDVFKRFTEKEINSALAGLNRDCFSNTPYIVPLLDMGELYEYDMKELSKRVMGFSYEGVMPVVMDNLLKSGLTPGPIDFKALQAHLKASAESPFLLKEN